jgi:hypothetical protein
VRSPLVRGHSLVPLASEVAQWQSDAGHAHRNARESLAREQPFDRLSELPADPQQDLRADLDLAESVRSGVPAWHVRTSPHYHRRGK